VGQKLTERQGRYSVGIGPDIARCRVETEKPHPVLSEKWLNSQGATQLGAQQLQRLAGLAMEVELGPGLVRWKRPSRGSTTRGCRPLKGSHVRLPAAMLVDEEGNHNLLKSE
jgi:hypothetical protein